ncbi:hypothetical protein ACOSQ2_003019 [Xanthoceras sorbifolium]
MDKGKKPIQEEEDFLSNFNDYDQSNDVNLLSHCHLYDGTGFGSGSGSGSDKEASIGDDIGGPSVKRTKSSDEEQRDCMAATIMKTSSKYSSQVVYPSVVVEPDNAMVTSTVPAAALPELSMFPPLAPPLSIAAHDELASALPELSIFPPLAPPLSVAAHDEVASALPELVMLQPRIPQPPPPAPPATDDDDKGSDKQPANDSKKQTVPPDLVDLALHDPKRAKRIMTNRLSAVRAKEKKKLQMQMLEHKWYSLQEKATTMSAELLLMQAENKTLTAENVHLKDRTEMIVQQMHLQDCLNDQIKCEIQLMKSQFGPIALNGGSTGANPSLNNNAPPPISATQLLQNYQLHHHKQFQQQTSGDGSQQQHYRGLNTVGAHQYEQGQPSSQNPQPCLLQRALIRQPQEQPQCVELQSFNGDHCNNDKASY